MVYERVSILRYTYIACTDITFFGKEDRHSDRKYKELM